MAHSISALRRWTILRRYTFFKSRSLLSNPGRSDYTPAGNTQVGDMLVIFRCFVLPDTFVSPSTLRTMKTGSRELKKEKKKNTNLRKSYIKSKKLSPLNPLTVLTKVQLCRGYYLISLVNLYYACFTKSQM